MADDAPAGGPGAGRGRRVVIWRHGETTHNALGIWQGHLDTPLSERGREQAAAAALALAALRPRVVVSSDLQRASATAQALIDALGGGGGGDAVGRAHLDPRLREIDVGGWQGLSRAQAAALTPGAAADLAAGVDVPRGETGETFARLCARVAPAAADALALTPAGECCALVTHGVAARAVAGHLLGLEPATTWRVLATLRNCHWGQLVETPLGWQVQVWNAGVTPGAEPVG